jgi:hypothetical protein
VTASTNLATGGPGRNFTFTVGAFN